MLTSKNFYIKISLTPVRSSYMYIEACKRMAKLNHNENTMRFRTKDRCDFHFIITFEITTLSPFIVFHN